MHLNARWIALIILLATGSPSSFPESQAQEIGSGDGASSEVLTPLNAEKLTRELESRMFRIAEFKALNEWGVLNRVRIWAAGGTATGVAVYVKQHLENEWLKKSGHPPKYFEGRFTYSYFDVYRSTQDADIVIDGKEEDALRLESYLKERFNYLEGSKSVWEVRLLNHSRGTGAGEKDPLLGFDFQNQNSDSFSTGMIEITDPPSGEARVRDLFQWNNHRNPKFLQDLVEGSVTFHRNPKHLQTKRARAGMNPEILSAIRVLTKALQYESRLRPEQEGEVRKIIEGWDPSAAVDPHAENQISKNGQKLFWHSPDVERAWNETERLGLRRKLIEFGQEHRKRDLAIWLNREPLRTLPFGTTGKTAKELGIDIVAHETDSFLAYENISRSLKGKPNVFQSREGHPGEEAVYGDGFYTRIGRKGARGSGLTVRFKVDPRAREGHDFILAMDYVIIRNAAAFRVIDESLDLTPVQYFELLANERFSADDKGLLEKFRLRLRGSSKKLSATEKKVISDLLARMIENARVSGGPSPVPMAREWLAMMSMVGNAAGHQTIHEWVTRTMARRPDDSARLILSHGEFMNHPSFGRWIDELMKVGLSEAITHVLSKPAFMKHPRYSTWVDQAIQAQIDQAPHYILNRPELVTHEKFDSWMIQASRKQPLTVARHLLSLPAIMEHPEHLKWMLIAIQSDPDTDVNRVIDQLLESGRGTLVRKLCPTGPVNTECLRRAVRNRALTSEDCSKLLRPE